MSIGWIQLHRSIEDHWIYDNPSYLKAWICILLNVNHESKKVTIDNELFECLRGSSLRSIQTWVRLFGKNWTSKKVRTFFKLLEDDSMIKYKGMRKTSHLTVCNYDTYQSKGNTEVTQKANRSNTEVTQKATNNNDNNYKNENNENSLESRQAIFRDSVKNKWEELGGINYMSQEEAIKFSDWWSESNPLGVTKFEDKGFFEISKRLGNWRENNTKKPNPNVRQGGRI